MSSEVEQSIIWVIKPTKASPLTLLSQFYFMAQIETLLPGLGVRAEEIFIHMARAAFSLLTEFQWHPDPDKSKIFIYADDSDVELDRLPQIRVSVGDMSEFKGSINDVFTHSTNDPQYRLLDQAYVMFTIYAGNSVEARDLADYLRNALFQAKSDLGKRGLFGIRNMGSSQPKAMEKGATTDKHSLSIVTAAFFAARTLSLTQEDAPLWERLTTLTVDRPTEITQISTDGFEVVRPVFASARTSGKKIHVLFSSDVAPFRPTGFSVEDDDGEIGVLAERSAYLHNKVYLHLDRLPSGSITVSYSGTGMYDLLEQVLVQSFTANI